MKTFTNVSVLLIVLVIVLFLLIVKFVVPHYEIILTFLWRITFPFIIAIIISYLLNPLMEKLMHVANMHQSSAIAIIFLTFFSLLSFLIVKGFPIFVAELQELSIHLPQLITMYEQMIGTFYEATSFFPEAVHEQMDLMIINLELTLEDYVSVLLERLINSFDQLVNFIIIPVLVFYLLKDYNAIRNDLLTYLPKKQQQLINRLLNAIHEAFGTYIRGQLLLSSFIFMLTFLLFNAINLKYALVLSLFASLMNVIPYFGPIIGAIPALVIALATSWKFVIIVLLITLFVQIIEGTLLSPYIMGKTAQLHPIVIIFILLVSSELAGVIGMIIAIPSVMIVKAILIQLNAQKQQCIDN